MASVREFSRAGIDRRIDEQYGILRVLRRDRELDPAWYDTQIDATLISIDNLRDELAERDSVANFLDREHGLAADDFPLSRTRMGTDSGQRMVDVYLAGDRLLELLRDSGMDVPDEFRETLWDCCFDAASLLMVSSDLLPRETA